MALRTALFAILSLIIIVPAHAAWHEASSEHFLIYADQSENDIREFAEQLEKYHGAMSYLTRKGTEPVSPSNRVTIFVVRNTKTVQRLLGDSSRRVGGFYVSRAGASVAFVPKVREGNGEELSYSEITLLHEYAHHFMYSYYSFSFPRWYSEGFAEFYSSAAFKRDGSVWLGRPAQHRAYQLFRMSEVPVELLLDTGAYNRSRKGRRRGDSFYGRSWLLFHYLTMDGLSPESKRKGQLVAYLNNMIAGKEPIDAATQAFGDLEILEKDLDKYLAKRRMNAFEISADKFSIGDIQTRRLSEGASKVMPLLAQSRRGVDTEQAAELLPKVRAVATKYPDDPFVNAALAEAEYDAGNDAEALIAADRALAVDPENMDAHKQRILATFRIAQNSEGEETAALWKKAMKAISTANKLEPDNPIPLIYYYRSYEGRGKQPTKLAKDALIQALGLAPYDKALRANVALQLISDGQYAYARNVLQPMLLDPHQTGSAEAAQLLLASIEGKQDGDAPPGTLPEVGSEQPSAE
ncbi:hypothetical protein [Alterisphingorhabdus coralli]|uniref:DUF1570 domain-containing protein n=1 Tax=Alterisphingorhabdus coralli TaxID=3071408 RepID=A0AA97F8M0_9SPHN|nr:hypothetical protein [Parasphingorhabdus sp. SCSIO 66989]WOE75931.1 hypothetical protein RB602_04235 [Parasphingorhabdus sp. SCSIO 66989]